METNGSYPQENPHRSSNRVVIGIVLVIAGFFLAIKNFGFLPSFLYDIIFSWQMLLIVIGLVMSLRSDKRTAGLILMSVGGFFLIPLIFHATFPQYNMFWPAIFIIIGVIFIFTTGSKYRNPNWRHHHYTDTTLSTEDFIDYLNIFSGGERQVISDNFKGGKVTSIFGGNEIDLTKAKLAPGRNELEIACVFGGTTLIVPDDWTVIIDIVPILGGFSDSRKLSPGRTVDPLKQLVIKGAVVFGGGEIKSY
jgi:predicted membrane protein